MLLLNSGVDVGTSLRINEVLSTQSAQNFIGKLESSIAARDRLVRVRIPRSLTPSCQGESGLEGSSLIPSVAQFLHLIGYQLVIHMEKGGHLKPLVFHPFYPPF